MTEEYYPVPIEFDFQKSLNEVERRFKCTDFYEVALKKVRALNQDIKLIKYFDLHMFCKTRKQAVDKLKEALKRFNRAAEINDLLNEHHADHYNSSILGPIVKQFQKYIDEVNYPLLLIEKEKERMIDIYDSQLIKLLCNEQMHLKDMFEEFLSEILSKKPNSYASVYLFYTKPSNDFYNKENHLMDFIKFFTTQLKKMSIDVVKCEDIENGKSSISHYKKILDCHKVIVFCTESLQEKILKQDCDVCSQINYIQTKKSENYNSILPILFSKKDLSIIMGTICCTASFNVDFQNSYVKIFISLYSALTNCNEAWRRLFLDIWEKIKKYSKENEKIDDFYSSQNEKLYTYFMTSNEYNLTNFNTKYT